MKYIITIWLYSLHLNNIAYKHNIATYIDTWIGGLIYCLLYSCVPCGCCCYGCVYTDPLRKQRGIQGSGCNDWICGICCNCCVQTRSLREIRGT